jgi:signal peptidase I
VTRRRVLVVLAFVVVVVSLGLALLLTELVVLVGGGGASMAPTIPACGEGGAIAEGFTYRFRDPHRGEIAVFHASGELGGTFTPDARASGSLEKRVVGIPGDTVVGRGGWVLVNGKRADAIRTPEFRAVHLEDDEYFVLGDNRTFSQDSRDFGPVPRNAIFARTVLIYWPLGRFGVPTYETKAIRTPPGDPFC